MATKRPPRQKRPPPKPKAGDRYYICPASMALHPEPIAVLIKRKSWFYGRCPVCTMKVFFPKAAWSSSMGFAKAECVDMGAVIFEVTE